MEDERIAALIQKLKSPDYLQQQHAAYNLLLDYSLRRLSKKAILQILALLEDTNLGLQIRENIVVLIHFFIADKRVVDALLKLALSEEITQLRFAAIAVLGDAKREDVFNFLMHTAKEETGQLQRAAIIGLGYAQDQRAIKTLKAFLEDEDFKFRGVMITALGQIGGDEVEDFFIKILETDDTSFDGYGLKYDVIRALEEMGSKRSLPILEKIKETVTTDPFDVFDGPSFLQVLDSAIQAVKENSDSEPA